jgi:hypothetical protein
MTQLLTARQAASNLNLKLPGRDPIYWRTFLANNRKQGRSVSDPIPYQREGKRVFYSMADLVKFAERWKALPKDDAPDEDEPRPKRSHKTAAFKWAVDGRHAAQGKPDAVRLKVMGLSFALPLTPSQARALADELLHYANKLDRPER